MDGMTLNEQAVRLALITWLSKELKKLGDAEREAIADWPEKTRIPAVLPDGTTVATVTMAKGAARVKVVDEAKFTAWVQEHRPWQIETRVRSAYVNNVVELEGGELPPGVEWVVGDPHPQVRLEKDAGEALGQAWRGGQLQLPELGEAS